MGWLLNTQWARQGARSIWTNPLTLNYLLGDVLVALCLFSLAASLLVLWRARRLGGEVYASRVALLMSAFLLLCGLVCVTHVLQWSWPALRLFVLLKYLTTVVGFAGCVVLPDYILRLAKTPTAQQVLHESGVGRDSTAELMAEVKSLKKLLKVSDDTAAYERQLRRRAIKIIQSIKDTKEAATNQTLAAAIEALRQIPDSDELRQSGV